jgi:hypothetical protein
MSILFAISLGVGIIAAVIAGIRRSPSTVTALRLDRSSVGRSGV